MEGPNTPKKRIIVRVRRDISTEVAKVAGRAVLSPSRPNNKPKNRKPPKPEPKPKGPATLPKTSIRRMEMEAANLKYYTFAQNIDIMERWFTLMREKHEKPNDAITRLILSDLEKSC